MSFVDVHISRTSSGVPLSLAGCNLVYTDPLRSLLLLRLLGIFGSDGLEPFPMAVLGLVGVTPSWGCFDRFYRAFHCLYMQTSPDYDLESCISP